MYSFKRLLVGLTGADRDKGTIDYAALVSRMVKLDRVYFLHAATSLDIPESIRETYPEILEPVDENLTEQMTKMVNERFPCRTDITVDIDVIEGTPLVEILRLVRQKEIDLILVGKTREHQESGMLPEKLARKAPCSVLVVPEGAQPRISKILVPVDFSDHSSDAMDVAIAVRSACTVPELVCAHVYRAFEPYQGYGVVSDDIMHEGVEKEYRAFIKGFDFGGCSVTPLFVSSTNPSRAIAGAIKEQQADLLAVGARGRTAAAALVLGSIAERLIASTEIPLIAVKKKGPGLSLLNALLPLERKKP